MFIFDFYNAQEVHANFINLSFYWLPESIERIKEIVLSIDFFSMFIHFMYSGSERPLCSFVCYNGWKRKKYVLKTKCISVFVDFFLEEKKTLKRCPLKGAEPQWVMWG